MHPREHFLPMIIQIVHRMPRILHGCAVGTVRNLPNTSLKMQLHILYVLCPVPYILQPRRMHAPDWKRRIAACTTVHMPTRLDVHHGEQGVADLLFLELLSVTHRCPVGEQFAVIDTVRNVNDMLDVHFITDVAEHIVKERFILRPIQCHVHSLDIELAAAPMRIKVRNFLEKFGIVNSVPTDLFVFLRRNALYGNQKPRQSRRNQRIGQFVGEQTSIGRELNALRQFTCADIADDARCVPVHEQFTIAAQTNVLRMLILVSAIEFLDLIRDLLICVVRHHMWVFESADRMPEIDTLEVAVVAEVQTDGKRHSKRHNPVEFRTILIAPCSDFPLMI